MPPGAGRERSEGYQGGRRVPAVRPGPGSRRARARRCRARRSTVPGIVDLWAGSPPPGRKAGVARQRQQNRYDRERHVDPVRRVASRSRSIGRRGAGPSAAKKAEAPARIPSAQPRRSLGIYGTRERHRHRHHQRRPRRPGRLGRRSASACPARRPRRPLAAVKITVPNQEHAAQPGQVAESPAQDHQRREREDVRREDPLARSASPPSRSARTSGVASGTAV